MRSRPRLLAAALAAIMTAGLSLQATLAHPDGRSDEGLNRRDAQRRLSRLKPVGIYPETKHPTYFDGIGLSTSPGTPTVVGANKDLIVPRNSAGSLLPPTTLIHDAHRAGLVVHGWTFRAENTSLPLNFRVGADPGRLGDLWAEMKLFLELGIDGYFTDHPGIGSSALDAFGEDR